MPLWLVCPNAPKLEGNNKYKTPEILSPKMLSCRNIIEEGGSAVDAAIAAAFCNGVVMQGNNGLGGGLSMMIHTQKEGGMVVK